MIHSMNESLVFHLNKANLNKIRDIMEVMPRNKHGKFLIDQSTVGLHLTGVRRINLEQCYIYAKILKIHPWKVIDDYVCRYPVVGNLNLSNGFVEQRGKFQNDYLVCSNDFEYIDGTLVVLSKSGLIAYLYNENLFLNEKNFNSEDSQRCIFEKEDGEILAFVINVDFKNHIVEYVLATRTKSWKILSTKYIKIRPINEVINLNTVSENTSIIEHTFRKPKQYY